MEIMILLQLVTQLLAFDSLHYMKKAAQIQVLAHQIAGKAAKYIEEKMVEKKTSEYDHDESVAHVLAKIIFCHAILKPAMRMCDYSTYL